MAIPELEAKRAERLLSRFCQERVPPHARHQVQLHFSKRGNIITLFERRPYFLDQTRHTDMPIARFQYEPEDKSWGLRWADRNDRWHPYPEFEGTRDFEALLEGSSRESVGVRCLLMRHPAILWLKELATE